MWVSHDIILVSCDNIGDVNPRAVYIVRWFTGICTMVSGINN